MSAISEAEPARAQSMPSEDQRQHHPFEIDETSFPSVVGLIDHDDGNGQQKTQVGADRQAESQFERTSWRTNGNGQPGALGDIRDTFVRSV